MRNLNDKICRSFQQTQNLPTTITACFNRNKLQLDFPLFVFNRAPSDVVLVRTATGLYNTSSLEKAVVSNRY